MSYHVTVSSPSQCRGSLIRLSNDFYNTMIQNTSKIFIGITMACALM